MILVDTSAWVEFLRGTGSGACQRVESELKRKIAICDPVRMEVLAGARDEGHLADLRGLLARATNLPTLPQHFEAASALHRACRREGETVRKIMDCLIAAVAIDEGVKLLHADSDFEAIARHSALQLA